MRFATYKDLVRDTLAWADANPRWRTLRGVVGVPRCGMLPAGIVATRYDLPLADLEHFLLTGGRFYPARHGRADGAFWAGDRGKAENRLLVLDDSSVTGATLKWAAAELRGHAGLSGHQLELGAVYGAAGCGHACAKPIDGPRIFEWNWTRAAVMTEAMVDMDGLLCEDPPPEAARDPRVYAAWLPAARPRFLPTRRVRAVVSARLEEHRQQTQEWLARWEVLHDELCLLDCTAEERGDLNLHARHKIHHYGQSASGLFVESDHRQAAEIHAATRKAVLCPAGPCGGFRLLDPGDMSKEPA